MLPKKFRLTPSEFYRRPSKSQTIKFSYGFVSLKPSNSDLPRFSVVVPFSLDKRASYRHASKRIIIEILRKYLATFKKNIDVMIKMSKIIKKEDRLLIAREIEKLFKKERLLRT